MDDKQTVVLAAMTILLIMAGAFLFTFESDIALDNTKKKKFKLIEKEKLNHNILRLRFALPQKCKKLGLPVGKHVTLSATVNGKLLSRPYSPISPGNADYMEIIVKVYFKNEHPKYPEGGKMSQYLNSLEIGDFIDCKGPNGKYKYSFPGMLECKRIGRKATYHPVKKIGMIAGGTGVTPMLSIIRAILQDPTDLTEVSLIFANNTEDDIFLRKELESLAEEHSNFKLWHTLVTPPKNWKYSKGFVDADLIKNQLPSPDNDTMFLICGPPPMVNLACKPALKSLGVKDENLFVW